MSKELTGFVQAALASGVLVLPACSSGEAPTPETPSPASAADNIPPTVVSAAIADGVLNLRFSEPLAPATAVDPSKFRLTFAYYSGKADSDYYYADYYTTAHVARTWYSDIGRFSLDATPARQSDATTIQIPLPADFNAGWVCKDIARMRDRDARSRAGLYLHYAEPGKPQVTDRRGNQLRSIAPYWLTAASSTAPGDFAGKPIPVTVRCP
jgi:hypothetical protein